MARRRRYRRRYRRLRWAKQMVNITHEGFTVSNNSNWSYNIPLCENPVDENTMVPTPRYFKRIKLSFEVENEAKDNIANFQIEGLTAFILYVPEGLTAGPALIKQHPEWVLGSKFYGSVSNESTGTSGKVFTLYSRLCKKLLSGDKIMVVFTGVNTDQSNSYNVYFNLFIEFFTR